MPDFDGIDPAADPPVQQALAWLRGRLPTWQVDYNTNRSVLLSMRSTRRGPLLRVHHRVLVDPVCLPHIATWASRRGGAIHPDLRQRLRLVQDMLRQHRQVDHQARNEPVVRHRVALSQVLFEVCATWFRDLDVPQIAWSRHRTGHIHAIRFGSYLRRPRPLIRIHPRLDQPWIATVFLIHVLHHEMCHHRQHRQPAGGLRREPVHSSRFRAWERAYPGYERARSWEREALPYLLGGTAPPWYSSAQESPPCVPPSC